MHLHRSVSTQMSQQLHFTLYSSAQQCTPSTTFTLHIECFGQYKQSTQHGYAENKLQKYADNTEQYNLQK